MNQETDQLRAEAALWKRAAEDKCEAPPPKESKNYSRFSREIAPKALNVILDRYEKHVIESQRVTWPNITGQVDVLQKVCAVVEQIEGMASEKQ